MCRGCDLFNVDVYRTRVLVGEELCMDRQNRQRQQEPGGLIAEGSAILDTHGEC